MQIHSGSLSLGKTGGGLKISQVSLDFAIVGGPNKMITQPSLNVI